MTKEKVSRWLERAKVLTELANRATRTNDYVPEMLSITSAIKEVEGELTLLWQAHFGMFDTSPNKFESVDAALDGLEENIKGATRG